jgi:hypothetical protein
MRDDVLKYILPFGTSTGTRTCILGGIKKNKTSNEKKETKIRILLGRTVLLFVFFLTKIIPWQQQQTK